MYLAFTAKEKCYVLESEIQFKVREPTNVVKKQTSLKFSSCYEPIESGASYG